MTIWSQPLNDKLFNGMLRAANALGPAIDRSGLGLGSLDLQTLLDTACRRAGLGDFGTPALEAPLRVLLDACQNEANLNLFGRISTRWDVPALADEPAAAGGGPQTQSRHR